MFEAGDGVVGAGFFLGVVKVFGEGFGEDAVDEGGFSRAGGAGNDGDLIEGDGDGEILEVVFAGSVDGDFGFWILNFGFFWDEAGDLAA